MEVQSDEKYQWYRENEGDRVWWLDNVDEVGEYIFSFDRVKKYNLFQDYPHNLTPEEKEIFDKENPFWVKFFADRQH